ncbi:MAG: VWA domain-containing protein [Armatimonadetes bacterium]|nr:VWA domain-containing protein [Armatimonadota bacterium]
MLHLISKPHRDTLRANAPDAQKLFVLLKVIPAAPLASVRPPLALALVIDTSGSMRESSRAPSGSRATSKLEHAIEATGAVLSNPRLVENDLISVIQFDDVARVVLPLSPLGNGRDARAALEKLKGYTGGTQVAQGLLAARGELSRILQGGVAQRVLLLTDGQAFDPDACREAAARLAEANVPLVSIGVGDDYNEELLRDLAEIGRGRPYHLPEIERLDEVFGAEVQSSVREVVTGLRAEVQTVSGVSLDSVTRVYPDLAEIEFSRDGAPLSLGNIMAGDYTVFVLELTVSGMARPEGRVRLAQVQLFGTAPTRDASVESPRHDIVVSFSDEQNRAEKVDEEVLGYVQQRNVDRLVQGAVRRSGHDLPGARQSLQSALEITRRVGNVHVTRLLQQSLDELGEKGQLSSSMRKTIALETRTRTIKTRGADALADLPSEDDIRRLTGA